jgi:nitrite reductase/ring-hydroxylating ferredoxin subunit
MATTVHDLSDVPPGTIKQIEHDGRAVALCNVDGVCYAIQGRCPHRMANLSEGTLDGDTIICPKHKGQFDLKTGVPKVWVAEPPLLHLLGKLIPPPMRRAKTYVTRIKDGNVIID